MMIKRMLMLSLLALPFVATGVAAEDDLDVTMDVIEDDADEERITQQLRLPESASEQGRESSEYGLDTANEARERGRDFGEDRAEEARERGEEARERARERADAAEDRRQAAENRRQERTRSPQD